MKALAAAALLACVVFPATAQESKHKNLQVLPTDISEQELGNLMLENLRGLGLRRLAGEGCLFCHVGDLETPRSQWDYASDAKPMKEKARVMMAMVKAINKEYLGSLKERVDPSLQVTCTTCHAGRTDPRPLPELLWAAYEAGGIDGAAQRYHELRERYFGADAYDFRVHILPRVALQLADRGAIDDAIALAALNVDVYPEVAFAKRASIALMLERTIDKEGVDAALAELTKLEPSLAADVLTPGLLDSLAWRLNRSQRETQGHALIEANHAKFPNEYTAIESLAFILSDTDRKEEAFAMLEAWLDENPDHARARRLLINLREEEGD
jgi:hypothetical protein